MSKNKKDAVKVSYASSVVFLAMMVLSLGLVGWVIWYFSDGSFLFSEPTLWILGALLFLAVGLFLIRRTTIEKDHIFVDRGFSNLCYVDLNQPVYYQFERMSYWYTTELTLFVSNYDFEDDFSSVKSWQRVRLKRDNKYLVAAVPYTAKVSEIIDVKEWNLVPGGDKVTPDMAPANDKHDRRIFLVLGTFWIAFMIWLLSIGGSPFSDVTYFEPEEETSTVMMKGIGREEYSYRMGDDTLVFDEFDLIDYAPKAEYIKAWTEVDRFDKSVYDKEQIANEYEIRYPGIGKRKNVDIKLTENSAYYYVTLTITRLDYAPKGAKVLRTGFHDELKYEDGAIYLKDAVKSLKKEGLQKAPLSQKDELLKEIQYYS